MTPKKPKRVQVYFASDNQELYQVLVENAKKYRLTVSVLSMYAIEAGLGQVLHHFEEMKSKSIKK
jgi:hypothetical protein